MGFGRFEGNNRYFLIAGLFFLVTSACSEGVDPQEQVSHFLGVTPAAPAGTGTHLLSAAGGNGNAGNGGEGGKVSINSTGDPLRLVKDGSVDANFTLPTEAENLGSNPRTVTADSTIAFDDGAATCPTTIPGDDSTKRATGLRVAAGTTLTLTPDPNCGGIVFLDLQDDAVIAGTVRSSITTAPNRAGLSLSVDRNFLTLPGSTIDTSGNDNAAGAGGVGGSFTVTAVGRVLLQGSIDTSGGNATASAGAGGSGGAVNVTSEFNLHNTGPVTAAGGTAANGIGGFGGTVAFRVDNGCDDPAGLFNSAMILTAGGNGSAGGGAGGGITLTAAASACAPALFRRDLFNSAALTANGGNATTAGSGGSGGGITLRSAGRLLHSADLSANGGDGLGAASSGGAGGAILIANSVTNESGPETLIAGNLLGNGGAGATGGNASLGSGLTGPNLQLLGFSTLDLHGGGAAGNNSLPNEIGGEGGDLSISSVDLRNELEILTSGGAGTLAGSGGGDGGAITVEADSFVNFGRMTADGGSGVDTGGSGNSIFLDATDVINNADLNARGGAAGNPTTGSGGNGGFVGITAGSAVSNSGTLHGNGGDGAFSGGRGGDIHFDVFGILTNSGAVNANGGNAAPDLAGSDGGSGGSIGLSVKNRPTSNSGVLSVVRGTGENLDTPADPGPTDGTILIDGSNVNPGDGTLP